MAEADQTFSYVAIAAAGGRVQGRIAAGSQIAAFERLKRDGLSPITLKPSTARDTASSASRVVLGDRRAAELFSSLGILLTAGADIRSALGMLSARPSSRSATLLCRLLLEEVSGGSKIDVVLANRLPAGQGFVAALVSAAEASGDLGSGFARAAEVLAARCKLRDQLVSTLSYPAFVLLSTVCAVFAILLFVVPTLAPLVQGSGAATPVTLGMLIWASRQLSDHLMSLIIAMVGGVVLVAVSARMGLLSEPLDAALLDGPTARLRSGLVYGSFSIVLGNMLSAGAPLSDALRLATRTAPSQAARVRLDRAAGLVRQGQLLSASLDQVRGFPAAISRMCAVGESSGSLGVMLSRAGRLEEEAAFRKVEAIGRLLGPLMIVLLGSLVGLLMAALLSGVSEIGQSVSQ